MTFKQDYNYPWIIGTLVIVLLVPLIGFVFFGITHSLVLKRSRSENLDKCNEFDEYTITREKEVDVSHVQRQEVFDEKIKTRSFEDIIRGTGANEEKINVLNVLSKNKTSESINLIQTALSDLSDEIRYVAAATLNKIEKDIMDEISVMEKKIEENPQNIELLATLANRCFDYCNMSILDAVNFEFWLEKSQKLYRKALNCDPLKTKLLLQLGKIGLMQNKYEEALSYIDQFLQKNSMEGDGYILKAEILFNFKRYEDLHIFMKEAGTLKIKNWDHYTKINEVWSGKYAIDI